MDKFITIKQVKELVPVSVAQIRRLVNEANYAHLKFPKPYRVGGRIFWSQNEILDWVEFQKQPRS